MKGDTVYLAHMVECIARVFAYTERGRAEFLASPIIQDAVIRNLEVLGEATKNLSPAIRLQHPEVPWRLVAGLRDVLIHDYLGIDLHEVWNVVEFHLPLLDRQLRALLAAIDRDS